jgi:hypothetical protein
MGKKKPEEMAKQRQIFVAGAGNGIEAEKANEIFDTMEKFAGYGFNKSHAAAYSLVAYQTAWLKPPSGGLHGGDAVLGNGRHRQGAVLRRRRRVATD